MATTIERQRGATPIQAEDSIQVENPATGQTIATLKVHTPEQLAEMVARARKAQPAWQALGFEERGKVLRRAQKWLLDNVEGLSDTLISESGKTREDVVLEMRIPVAAFGFWARQAPTYLADAKVRTSSPFLLGGKDPMLVLADADLERAANAAVFWSMQNAGQTCISVERVYVEEPIHDEFVSLVADKAKELRQGVPEGFGSVDVGSFINPPQADIVKAHVEDAVNKGARVLAGGHGVDGPGSFFEPTVIAGADHSMAAMTDETFGPTLPIMKVHDEDEAVRMDNDSPYRLQASVFTKDMSRADRVARQLQAGAVVVNDCVANYSAFEAPMGGWKSSGIGVRHGPQGIRKYTHPQTIVFTRFAMKKDLYMFPYTKRRSEFLVKLLRFLYGRGKRD